MKFGKTPVPKDSAFPRLEDTAKGLIRFSFKYLDLSHSSFSIKDVTETYLSTLLSRLRDVSTWPMKEFHQNRSKSLRMHPINWVDRRVSVNGFNIPNRTDLNDEAYQFNITEHEHGRVLGFIIGDTFFVRWLDRHHKCYNS